MGIIPEVDGNIGRGERKGAKAGFRPKETKTNFFFSNLMTLFIPKVQSFYYAIC